ncbi:MAG: hypothetical protein EPO07_20600 [Verrucomicrobia bacterium]|nr:MAG: hypothetical protein EPO07_20600 [Verrucomicrobiota bacterium]
MKIILALSLCATLSLTLHAQDAAKAPVALRASVGEVTDNRTTGSFNSECKVELKFTGDAAADASTVRKVTVKKAVDESGRDLIPKESDDSWSSSSSSHKSGALKYELKLRNPSRNATVIKLVEGEVELFNPTPANGGILVIKDILKHPAEPVQNPVLKKYGIELMYLTKESYEAKKKQIEQQQKDAAGGAIGEAFGDLFKGMFGGMMSSESKNNLKLYVKDADKRVIEVEFQDANGKALKRRSSWSSQEMRSQDFDAAPPADTQLLIQLATPEATQSFPFKVENIPLP